VAAEGVVENFPSQSLRELCPPIKAKLIGRAEEGQQEAGAKRSKKRNFAFIRLKNGRQLKGKTIAI